MSTETEGFTPDPTDAPNAGESNAPSVSAADSAEPVTAVVGETPEAHLATVANQVPDGIAADSHATSVALAHESFKLRIENAYSELKTSLDNAWHVYLKDRGIETAGSEIVQDLEGSNASTGDATRAR